MYKRANGFGVGCAEGVSEYLLRSAPRHASVITPCLSSVWSGLMNGALAIPTYNQSRYAHLLSAMGMTGVQCDRWSRATLLVGVCEFRKRRLKLFYHFASGTSAVQCSYQVYIRWGSPFQSNRVLTAVTAYIFRVRKNEWATFLRGIIETSIRPVIIWTEHDDLSTSGNRNHWSWVVIFAFT